MSYLRTKNAKFQAQKATRELRRAQTLALEASGLMAKAATAMTDAQALMARGTPAAGDETAWADAQTTLIERSAQLRPGLAIP